MTTTEQASDGNLPAGTVAVVVVAAGSGERLDAGVPKAFVELGGKTLLEHSLEAVVWSGAGNPAVQKTNHSTFVVVVVPDDYIPDATKIVAKVENEVSLYEGGVSPFFVGSRIVPGGSTRQESVAAGLAAIPGGIEHVLIHDAARALAPGDLFIDVLEALESGAQVVVPALPVVDTIKQVHHQGERDLVVGTPDRSSLRAVQTPQGFKLETLRELHTDAANLDVTDDAGLAEQAGIPVDVVDGSRDAFKITTPDDLDYARFVLTRETQYS